MPLIATTAFSPQFREGVYGCIPLLGVAFENQYSKSKTLMTITAYSPQLRERVYGRIPLLGGNLESCVHMPQSRPHLIHLSQQGG
jgi:hypothetical protein